MERRESFRERRKRQQARRRLLGKLAAVLIGAVFLFGLCKKTADQFLLTDEKNRTAISGSRMQAIWSGSLQTAGRGR